MELYGQFISGKILPEHNSDYDKLGKIRPNTTYKIKITKPRNYEFHKKFFSLLNLCYDNQEVFNNLDDLRHYLTIKAGFYKRVNTGKGDMILPKSISFSSMDDIEFNELYSRVMDQVCLMLDTTNDEIVENLAGYL